MARSKYSKEFKIRVAKEASLPENEGLERVIAGKYGLLPSDVGVNITTNTVIRLSGEGIRRRILAVHGKSNLKKKLKNFRKR